MAAVVPAKSITLLPPATAAPHSPSTSPLCARWAATSEEEQAVSVLTQGPARRPRERRTPWLRAAARCTLLSEQQASVGAPVKPNVYEMRPTMKLSPLPVTACKSSGAHSGTGAEPAQVRLATTPWRQRARACGAAAHLGRQLAAAGHNQVGVLLVHAADVHTCRQCAGATCHGCKGRAPCGHVRMRSRQARLPVWLLLLLAPAATGAASPQAVAVSSSRMRCWMSMAAASLCDSLNTPLSKWSTPAQKAANLQRRRRQRRR